MVPEMMLALGAAQERRISTDSNASARKFLDFGSSTDVDDNFTWSDFRRKSCFLCQTASKLPCPNILRVLKVTVLICKVLTFGWDPFLAAMQRVEFLAKRWLGVYLGIALGLVTRVNVLFYISKYLLYRRMIFAGMLHRPSKLKNVCCEQF